MDEKTKAFYGGICAALQIVSAYDYGIAWHDIVNACGYDEIKKYVTKIEPEEFELIEFKKYAKSEFGKIVCTPRKPPTSS